MNSQARSLAVLKVCSINCLSKMNRMLTSPWGAKKTSQNFETTIRIIQTKSLCKWWTHSFQQACSSSIKTTSGCLGTRALRIHSSLWGWLAIIKSMHRIVGSAYHHWHPVNNKYFKASKKRDHVDSQLTDKSNSKPQHILFRDQLWHFRQIRSAQAFRDRIVFSWNQLLVSTIIYVSLTLKENGFATIWRTLTLKQSQKANTWSTRAHSTTKMKAWAILSIQARPLGITDPPVSIVANPRIKNVPE